MHLVAGATRVLWMIVALLLTEAILTPEQRRAFGSRLDRNPW